MDESAALRGAIAGLVATAPMSLAMELMHRQLPPHERYPLPPSEITTVAEREALGRDLDPETHTAATLAAHFGYGAATGAIYGALAGERAGPLSGAGFGLLVWGTSYLWLLPALGVLRPATEHPPRRTALMIAAHLVWGAAMGAFCEAASTPPSDPAPQRTEDRLVTRAEIGNHG